jgi:hypothetical protein
VKMMLLRMLQRLLIDYFTSFVRRAGTVLHESNYFLSMEVVSGVILTRVVSASLPSPICSGAFGCTRSMGDCNIPRLVLCTAAFLNNVPSPLDD